MSRSKVFCYQNRMMFSSKITGKNEMNGNNFLNYIFSAFNCAEPFGFYHSLLLIESGART